MTNLSSSLKRIVIKTLGKLDLSSYPKAITLLTQSLTNETDVLIQTNAAWDFGN